MQVIEKDSAKLKSLIESLNILYQTPEAETWFDKRNKIHK